MIKQALLLFAVTSSLGVAVAGDSYTKTPAASSFTDAAGTAVTLAVSGVTCGGSAAAFHAAVIKIDGVNGATVDPSGKAQVKFDAAKLDVDKLIAAVAESGRFTATKADEA